MLIKTLFMNRFKQFFLLKLIPELVNLNTRKEYIVTIIKEYKCISSHALKSQKYSDFFPINIKYNL